VASVFGSDAVVELPANVAVLDGYTGDGASGYSWKWTKVAGPDSYSIESPTSNITKVTNLEPGLYEFELAVEGHGLTGRDTVGVLVYDPRVPGVNEVKHENLQWYCPMGCSLYVGNIRAYAPHGSAIKVFLQGRDAVGYTTEIEIPPASHRWATDVPYGWEMSKRTLVIFGDDEYPRGPVRARITF
jgi:hypothetical protein